MKLFDIIVRERDRSNWSYHSLEVKCEGGETCRFRVSGAGAISEERTVTTRATGLVVLVLWNISAPQSLSD